MNYLYYFYPGLIILGVITSYTDLKFRLIRNRHLLYALVYGIAIYIYIFLKSYHLSFARIILSITIAIGIAYFLYLKRLWSTGDAKLFIAFSFLMPYSKYEYLFKFPPLVLFINTVIISTVVVTILNLKYILNLNKLTRSLIAKEELAKLFYIIVIAFSVTWLIWLLFEGLAFLDPLLQIIIIYLSYSSIYTLIFKIKGHKLIFALAILMGIVMRLLIQPEIFFSLGKFMNYILIVLKYSIFFKLLSSLFSANTSPVKDKKDNIAFAPFIFLGAITSETPFIHFVFRLLQFLRG